MKKIQHNSVEKTDRSAILLLIFAPLFWAGNFIIGRALHNTVPPFAFAFYRWLFVVLAMAPFILPSYKKFYPEIKKYWHHLLGLSFLSVFVYTSFLYWGLNSTTVINASLLNAIVPVLILIFSAIFLKEKIKLIKIIAIVFSFLGAAIIITNGELLAQAKNLSPNKGNIIILCGVISWAIFSIWYKTYPGRLPPFVFLFTTAVLGDVMLFPAYLYESHLGYHLVFTINSLAGIAYAGVFASILGFNCWNQGVKKIGPSKAGYFFNLIPVFSVLLAILLLEEKLHFYQIAGILLVFFGVFLANSRILTKK